MAHSINFKYSSISQFDYDLEAIQYDHNTEGPITMHIEFSNVPGYIDNQNFGKQVSHMEWYATNIFYFSKLYSNVYSIKPRKDE